MTRVWEALTPSASNDAIGDGPVLLVGTRKGAWLLRTDAARRSWASDRLDRNRR